MSLVPPPDPGRHFQEAAPEVPPSMPASRMLSLSGQPSLRRHKPRLASVAVSGTLWPQLSHDSLARPICLGRKSGSDYEQCVLMKQRCVRKTCPFVGATACGEPLPQTNLHEGKQSRTRWRKNFLSSCRFGCAVCVRLQAAAAHVVWFGRLEHHHEDRSFSCAPLCTATIPQRSSCLRGSAMAPPDRGSGNPTASCCHGTLLLQ